MSDILTLARENDLPPKWDGLVVLWDGWQYAPSGVFVCPPPKNDVCEGCKAPKLERGFPTWSTNKGLVAVSGVLTHADLRYEEENRKRLGRIAHKRKARALYRLTAFRCNVCSLDEVWDMDTDEWWVLDHTDYSDDGSVY